VPKQIVESGPAVASTGVKVTLTESVALHPAGVVAVTAYVVLEAGEALGLEHPVQLRPDEGDHIYVLPPGAPVTFNGVESLGQMLTSEPAFGTGNELTVTVTLAVFEQPVPEEVPVTV